MIGGTEMSKSVWAIEYANWDEFWTFATFSTEHLANEALAKIVEANVKYKLACKKVAKHSNNFSLYAERDAFPYWAKQDADRLEITEMYVLDSVEEALE